LFTGSIVTLVALVIGCIVARRSQTLFADYAAEHTLFVSDDGLLFQDGQVESKVLFDSIDNLAIRRRRATVKSIILTHDAHRTVLEGYENFQLLAQLLQEKVRPERVPASSRFHV
jgi:hypothetical protein